MHGTFRVDALYKNGTQRIVTCQNMWSDYMVYDVLNTIYYSVNKNYTPLANLWLSNYPSQLLRSAAVPATVFGGYQTYVASMYQQSSFYGVAASSYTNSSNMNAGNHPCYLNTNLIAQSWAVDGLYKWDNESFTVDEIFGHTTFLARDTTAGATTIYVVDASKFVVGGYVRITDFKGYDVGFITTVNTTGDNYIIISIPTVYQHNKYTGISQHTVLIRTSKTILTAQVNVGSNALTVLDSAGFTTGQKVMIYDGSTIEANSVASTGTNSIILSTGVATGYPANTTRILGGFIGAHASGTDLVPVNTVYLGSCFAYRYIEWFITDDVANNFGGADAIKTLAICGSNNSNIFVSVLLPFSIPKDGVTDVLSLRVAYYLLMTTGV